MRDNEERIRRIIETCLAAPLTELHPARAAAAVKLGLQTGLGVPVRGTTSVLAVLVLFDRSTWPPDEDLEETIDDATRRIGQFVERQRAQDALQDSEDRVRQLQRLEAVGRLAGGVAHDFNNLLTVIMGRAAMLLARREMVFRAGSDLGRVKADPSQVEQVIANLAVNARDAMPAGGRLTIETTTVELGERYTQQHAGAKPGMYVMLAVSDTGVGMDRETQARIFEPFFTTKETGKGTGLGLATVYGIVKQSGGNVWVYSEPGKGTTFKIYLPRVDDVADAPELARTRPSGGTETILVVEDEDEVRALACEVLKTFGYAVLDARTPAAALVATEQHPDRIHLLLTDVVMPQMGGRMLAERLTALRPGIKVVYMSGYTDDAIVQHGTLEAGVAFLQKPFTLDALAARIRQRLDTDTAG